MSINTIPIYTGSVVGVSFEPAKSNIPLAVDYFKTIVAAEGDFEPLVTLKPNPANKYDKNALEVHIGYKGTSFFVGHIPKTHNVEILTRIDMAVPTLERFNFDQDGIVCGLTITIHTVAEPFEA